MNAKQPEPVIEPVSKNGEEKLTTIYALIDPRNGELFYVGKSNNPSQRLYKHLSHPLNSGNAMRFKGITAAGLLPEIVTLEICPIGIWEDRERFWISKMRDDGVRLTNLTDGGNGKGDISEREHEARVRAWTPERREAMSKWAKAKNSDPVIMAENIRRMKERMTDPKNRAKCAEGIRKKFAEDMEFRKAHAERMKARSTDPIFAARRLKRLEKLNADPKFIQAKRDRLKKMLLDPAMIVKRAAASSRVITKLNADPEFRAKRNQELKKRHCDPEFAAARDARLKALHANPEFTKKISEQAKIHIRKLHADPKFRAAHADRCRIRMKRLWENQDFRDRKKEERERHNSDPIFLDKQRRGREEYQMRVVKFRRAGYSYRDAQKIAAAKKNYRQ
jgi:hypothetical protein